MSPTEPYMPPIVTGWECLDQSDCAHVREDFDPDDPDEFCEQGVHGSDHPTQAQLDEIVAAHEVRLAEYKASLQ